MNRSVVRELQAPGLGVERGEVLLPTEIGEPVRGALRCPAAPLIGGTLQRKGRRVSYAPVPRCDDPSHDSDGATVFVVTCQQADGASAALAAAAAPADRLAVAAARAAVTEWAAVLGPRRLLAAASPWCGGARQALELTRRAAADRGDDDRTVYVYGQFPGSAQDGAELAELGAVCSSSLPDMRDGDVLVLPAHGVPPAVREQAAQRGLDVVDATCPLIARAQDEAGRAAARGDHLVLIGLPGHPAAAGIAARADGRCTVVGSAAGTATLQVDDARRVSYLLQPGLRIEETLPVAAALRSRFPAARGPRPDGFCYAASDRADTVRAVCSGSDLVLVLGEPACADTRQLTGLVRDCGARPGTVAGAGEITPAMLAGAATIGLAESTSASRGLAGHVTRALAGLGPLSVVRRQVSSEVAGQPQPTGPAVS
jgi:4-hydroxy-3-methylbut-2-en-1-yl diphosphate reductase